MGLFALNLSYLIVEKVFVFQEAFGHFLSGLVLHVWL